MKILIKQVQVVDQNSSLNGQSADILIEDGIIKQMGDISLPSADTIIDVPGLFVSPGWVDCFVHFCDPGYEYKETIETGAAAAAAGGFTDVFVIPNTKPVIDSKGLTEYVRQKSASLPVTIHPIGAITKNTDGKELAEMYDMRASGAIAFSDGLKPVQSSGLLVKALQYIKAFDGIIIQVPDDQSISPHGLMNEGVVSTQLGLSGKPAMAEEIIVARDIKLARYTDSKLHFTGISSAKSIEYIKRGKETGISITSSVTPYHLYFTEDDLTQYDTNLKVNPPLRTVQDKSRLLEAVKNGVVDCVTAHHLPHETDSKVSEFEYAKNGMTGLETSYALLNEVLNGEQSLIVKLLSENPRKIFGLAPAAIKEGEPASLTIFAPGKDWVYGGDSVKSRSRNSPFIDKQLKGKVYGIINKGYLFINQ